MKETDDAVFRFDVAMYNVHTVNELQRRAQLNHQLTDVLLCVRQL